MRAAIWCQNGVARKEDDRTVTMTEILWSVLLLQRVWAYHTHAALFQPAGRLFQKDDYDDGSIKRWFHWANSLRQSFYENVMTARSVQVALAGVSDLVKRLGDL